TTDATLDRLGITRDQLAHQLEASRAEVNNLLPKFAQLTAFEVRNEEFIKTPKKNIKRYLYK
ncbi:MAG: long-chain fatty acid--CoA ligase, partial [Bacteroidaceae bacterium]|nr:long-chain fatty acid--CoA ligase [Bacteroidaceae bacterium]